MKKNNLDLEKRLSPDEYRSRLRKIDIHEIFLNGCSVKFRREKISKALQVAVERTNSFYIKRDDNLIEIVTDYKISAYSKKKSEYAVLIKATFILSLTSIEDAFDDDFYKIFKEVNLPINIWPYLREFINSITLRMNLTPLTLPFFKTN